MTVCDIYCILCGPRNNNYYSASPCVFLSVYVCVFVCPRSYLRNYTSDPHQFLCMLTTAVAQSSSNGVVIRYVLPVLWVTSYLLISQGCLGLGYKMCVIVPVAGQRTHGTTFRALKVTSQVATVCGLSLPSFDRNHFLEKPEQLPDRIAMRIAWHKMRHMVTVVA